MNTDADGSTPAVAATEIRTRHDCENSSAARQTLPELFKQTGEILNECQDGLIVQLQANDAEFVSTYQTAGKIVSTDMARKSVSRLRPHGHRRRNQRESVGETRLLTSKVHADTRTTNDSNSRKPNPLHI